MGMGIKRSNRDQQNNDDGIMTQNMEDIVVTLILPKTYTNLFSDVIITKNLQCL